MRLDQARVVLRPRTVSEMLDLALRFCVAGAPGLLLRLSALVLLPVLIGLGAMLFAFDWTWLWVWVAALVAGSLVQGVFTAALGVAMFAPEVTVAEALRAFADRAIPYFGAWFVGRVVLGLSWALGFLIFPVPLAAAGIFFLPEAAILEQAGPADALRRSWRLSSLRGSAAVVGTSISILAAQCVFMICAELLLNDGLLDFVLQLGKPLGSTLEDGGTIFALFGYLLSVPFAATARFLAYVDRRTRRDGWDIQLRFLAIQTEAQASEERAA
jgi:hypothetical protein